MGGAITSFESGHDALPSSVRPAHYLLSLFDLDVGGKIGQYKGRVEIDVRIQEATRTVSLNSHLLNVLSAYVTLSDGAIVHMTNILHDVLAQRCHIELAQKLLPSSDLITITVSFEGVINDDLTGFYRFKDPFLKSSAYQHDYTCATQFEPSDARRAFPCFDEPGLKATFEVSLQIPEKLASLSNMPVARVERDVRKPGVKVVHFEPTPTMSTYLLAWTIGGFDFLEAIVRRKHGGTFLPIRVYTSPGQKNRARFALDLACRTIHLFSEMFGIDYPLAKLDLVSLLELSDDAMENWGLVTFRTTALLIDVDNSDFDSITFAAYVITHELAHQWFGNLVTMSWWDDLWLNEGFATWAGWAACHEFFPEWDVWGQFIVGDMGEALNLDSLPSSHPVQAHVPDGLEVDSFFDTISYLKSAAIIRMLAAHIGRDALLGGVNAYLIARSYESATADDLWEAVSRTSGHDIAVLMNPWIKQMGRPLILVEDSSQGAVSIRQDDVSMSRMRWNVPIGTRIGGEIREDLLDITPIRYSVQDRSIKANVGHTGFFRTQYSPRLLQKLTSDLLDMPVHDQVGLLSDAMALAWSGSGPSTDTVLTMICNLAQSSEAIAWLAIESTLARIQTIFSADVEIRRDLCELTQRLTQPAVKSLGWSFHSEDTYNTKRLRTILIPLSGLAGGEAEVEVALRGFEAWVVGDQSGIHPFLLPAVVRVAVKFGGSSAVSALWSIYARSENPDTREMIASGLGQIQDSEVARACLSKAFQPGPMVTQDASTLIRAMARNGAVSEALWAFLEDEWPAIVNKLAGSMAIFDPFIRNTLQHFASEEIRGLIEVFFDEKDTTGYAQGLGVAKAFVEANIAYRKRDLERVRCWLRSR